MTYLPSCFKVDINGFCGFPSDTRDLHDGSRLLDDKKILNQLYILTREYKSVNERTTPFPPLNHSLSEWCKVIHQKQIFFKI